MKSLLTCLLAASATLAAAQTTPTAPNPASTPDAASAPASISSGKPFIEKGSKVFIEPMGGFETYLAAAILKKQVPLQVVDNAVNADYIIGGGSKIEAAGWAKTLFVSPLPHATASIAVKNKAGALEFAYAVDKSNARKGDQSTAEACAKHLKDFIDKGSK